MEATLGALIQRLDGHDVAPQQTERASPASPDRQSSQLEDAAPVFMIREVANELGVQSPVAAFGRADNETDVLARAGINASTAHEIVSL